MAPRGLPALSPLIVTALAFKPGQEPRFGSAAGAGKGNHRDNTLRAGSPILAPAFPLASADWGSHGAQLLSPTLLPSIPTHHSLLGLDEGPAEAVHFGVEPAGVAQVVAGAVPPPQRGLDGAAVDALPALGQVLQQL